MCNICLSAEVEPMSETDQRLLNVFINWPLPNSAVFQLLVLPCRLHGACPSMQHQAPELFSLMRKALE